jgi:hypothetical protein
MSRVANHGPTSCAMPSSNESSSQSSKAWEEATSMSDARKSRNSITRTGAILVVNCGSSSVRFALFD